MRTYLLIHKKSGFAKQTKLPFEWLIKHDVMETYYIIRLIWDACGDYGGNDAEYETWNGSEWEPISGFTEPATGIWSVKQIEEESMK